MCFKHFLLVIFCSFLFQFCIGYRLKGCKLDLTNRDREKLSPLLLYNYTTYLEVSIPQNGIINLNTGDTITVACTGKRNYLTATNSNASYATCERDSKLKIVRKSVDFEDLKCKKDIRGDVRKTSKKCAKGEGYITEIGYQVAKNYWVTLIEVCYDDDTGVTFYTKHNLHGSEINYSSKIIERPSFSTEGLGPRIAASVAYTRQFQKSTLNKILGSAHLAETYINVKSYLARGHLSPDGDFLINNLKRASYYYINVCPQWQIINGGNWKSVETSIRKTAEKYNRTFVIFTGTYGVLSLPDINYNSKPLYLVSGSKLPVPRHIWKIMYDPETQMGIAIIVMNNPFVTGVSEYDLICPNICNKYEWSTINWSDASRGYTYCCDLGEFFRVVRTAPSLRVVGVLRGTNPS